jgi:methylmalonyl-CoA mutase
MSETPSLPANPFPTASHDDWRARVEAVLKGADFEKKLVSRTHDGLRIPPLAMGRMDGVPVAGAQAGQPWRVMARVDHPVAEEAARLAREDLEGGADALALTFPGGRVARVYGLPCETLADLDAALADVRIELIQLRLDPAPAGRIHALMLAALVERRKLNPAQMSLDFGMDPVSSLTSLGMVPWDWPSMAARLGETVSALLQRGFRGPFLTVDLRPYHEAGASEGQELAAALAQGVLYLRALEAHGVSLADALRALSFIIPVDADQFLGIAKLRAFRTLWAKIAASCGENPQPAVIHAETSWRMLTKRDPHVNILRAAIATFAAGVGGADSVTVLPFTQALGLPDAAARRLARNTSIVLMEEASLWRVADPAAGAGGYENLTDDLAAKAWSLFQEIEREGGLVESLAAGKLQVRIAVTAKARARAIATRKEPLTGTSEFANLTEVPPAVLDVRPSQQGIPQAKAHAQFGMGTSEGIAALLGGASRHDAAPPMTGRIDAPLLVSHRLAEPFEALRDQADAVLAATGRRPRVTLVTLGPLADHAARLAFVRNFFEAGGLDVVVLPSLLPLAGEGAERSEADESKLACLVGTDAAYAESATVVARDLTASGHVIWLAGKPGAMETVGVSRFVYAGCDAVETLAEAHAILAASRSRADDSHG